MNAVNDVYLFFYSFVGEQFHCCEIKMSNLNITIETTKVQFKIAYVIDGDISYVYSLFFIF